VPVCIKILIYYCAFPDFESGSYIITGIANQFEIAGSTPMTYTRTMVFVRDQMKKERNIGQEILDGIKEIKAWQRGEKKLKTTRVSLPVANDVSKIRRKLGLSQEAFATFMGVSVATLRNWEQGRREPHGSARSLLLIAMKVPSAFLKAFELKKVA
jgi:putative transcriptional regulator